MKKTMTYMGLLIAVLFWGLSFLSIHRIVGQVGALELNVIRFTGAALILWIIKGLRPGNNRLKRQDYLVIFISGSCGIFGYYSLINLALLEVAPGTVGMISGAMPIMTMVVAMLFVGMKTKFRNVLLIGLSFAGIWLINGENMTQASIKAIWLVLFANFLFVVFLLMNERLSEIYEVVDLLTWQMTSAVVVFWGVYLYYLSTHPSQAFIQLDQLFAKDQIAGHLVFLTIFGALATYYLYQQSIRSLGATITSLFINVIPVMTVLMSVAVGNEVLTFNKVLGGLMIVVAVFFLEDV